MWIVFFSLLKVEKSIYFAYLSYHFLIIWLGAFYNLRLTMFFPCCQGPDLWSTFRLPPTSSEPLSIIQLSALHETRCLRITYLDLGYMKYYAKSVITTVWPEEKSVYWNSNSIHYHYVKELCVPSCLRVPPPPPSKKNSVLWLFCTCDPLCEIQAKVSKPNYEITSIQVWFIPLILLWF